MVLASFSDPTTWNLSPASGTPVKPSTSTGMEGPATFIRFPRSSIMARTFPEYLPETNTSPTFNVPDCTRTVETAPRPLSTCASMTTPRARLSGFAFNSRSAASSRSISNKKSMPVPSIAEVSTQIVCPPHSSGTSSCVESCCLTKSGRAPETSILLIATTIGTFAALA